MPETCIVKCPSCDNSLEFPREIAGHETDCPVCGGKVKLEVFVEQTTKVNIAPKTRRKLPSPRRIVDWLRSFRKPTPPAEPIPNLDSPEGLQQEVVRLRQKVHELEEEVKPSKYWGHLYIFNVLLAFAFPVVTIGCLMTYVIPKFKTIFTGMLGPGETLPEFTLLVLKISDTIRYNAVAVAIVLVPICFVFVRFTRFKLSSLSRDTRMLIYTVSFWCTVFLLISIFSALSLPVIKMMDQLGQGP